MKEGLVLKQQDTGERGAGSEATVGGDTGERGASSEATVGTLVKEGVEHSIMGSPPPLLTPGKPASKRSVASSENPELLAGIEPQPLTSATSWLAPTEVQDLISASAVLHQRAVGHGILKK